MPATSTFVKVINDMTLNYMTFINFKKNTILNSWKSRPFFLTGDVIRAQGWEQQVPGEEVEHRTTDHLLRGLGQSGSWTGQTRRSNQVLSSGSSIWFLWVKKLRFLKTCLNLGVIHKWRFIILDNFWHLFTVSTVLSTLELLSKNSQSYPPRLRRY